MRARATGGNCFSKYSQKIHRGDLLKLIIVKFKKKSLKYEKIETLSKVYLEEKIMFFFSSRARASEGELFPGCN